MSPALFTPLMVVVPAPYGSSTLAKPPAGVQVKPCVAAVLPVPSL
jgi:hypothetical protein